MTKERRLGRGLEALLGQLPARNETAVPAQQAGTPAATARRRDRRLPAARRHRPPRRAIGGSAVLARWSARRAGPTLCAAAPSPSSGDRRSAQPSRPQLPARDAPCVRHRCADAPARVNVRQIDSNPAQPRQDFDPKDMQSLAESISTHGLLQPVVVRQVHERYQLVAGERRLRAAIQAGWVDVPVNVVEADDRQMAELAIVENLQRKDLNPLEKAASFQKYLDQYGCTQEELAGRLKLDRSTIANLIRLLELPEPVQDAIRRGKITQGHARALLPLGDEREQIEFCRRIEREGDERPADGDAGAGGDRLGRPRAAFGRRNAGEEGPIPPRQERAHRRVGAAVPHRVGAKGEDHPQRPRPRQAGGPVPQSRGVRAVEEARCGT